MSIEREALEYIARLKAIPDEGAAPQDMRYVPISAYPEHVKAIAEAALLRASERDELEMFEHIQAELTAARAEGRILPDDGAVMIDGFGNEVRSSDSARSSTPKERT